ncbi:MAG: hypothetical protein Q4Q17_02670 [Tissierellia bacterium]|nr:hypothetical protein [Tissierellia bacterium]
MDDKDEEYSGKRKVNVSADRAFQVLKHMDRWLVNLDMITKVEYEAEPFFYEGRTYRVIPLNRWE